MSDGESASATRPMPDHMAKAIESFKEAGIYREWTPEDSRRSEAQLALEPLIKAQPGPVSWLPFINTAQENPYTAHVSVFERTALHAATTHLRPEYCRLLLSRGADPNAPEAFQQCTPLHFVVFDRSNFQEMARSNGLAPVLDTEDDLMLLEEECVDVLLRGGARMDAKDKRGDTALMRAIQYRRVAPLRAMLRAAGDAGAPGWGRPGVDTIVANAENSLLLAAVEYQSYDAALALCETGVKFVEDKDRPPLRPFLKEYGMVEFDELLEEHGL